MNIPGLIFILAAHFLAGRGLLGLFKIKQKPAVTFLLSMITGIVLLSQVPFLLQLCYIPIIPQYVITGICVMVLALNITPVRKYDYRILKLKLPGKLPPLYDLIFIVTFIILMLPSVWYCFFYPPYARDMLSGPEPLAEYAIREHTLINSIFTVNLESTNNHIKPPFVAGLQIIYKMLAHPFGQLWVNFMALSFIAWIFILLREKLHPLVAGTLMLFFICAPDVYAYTYIMLFGYSNMVLFFAGIYFLVQYFQTAQYNQFIFSAFLFGLATAIRSETLILVAFIVPLPIIYFLRHKTKPVRIILNTALPGGISFFFYYIWIGLYLKYYIPQQFDVSEQINPHLADVSVFFAKLSEMNGNLIFAGQNLDIYGWVVYLFLAVLLADLLFYRKFNTEAKVMLYSIAVVYFGMAFIGYLIPWVDMNNTTKRGLFKYIPLMILYMRNSSSLLALSERIKQFERPPAKEIKPAAVIVQPQNTGKKKRK